MQIYLSQPKSTLPHANLRYFMQVNTSPYKLTQIPVSKRKVHASQCNK